MNLDVCNFPVEDVFLFIAVLERMNYFTYDKQPHIFRVLVARLRRRLVPEAGAVPYFYTVNAPSASCTVPTLSFLSNRPQQLPTRSVELM
jgi:hypothetical protein